ncbi:MULTISPECIES: copper resistance protein B [unclassified Sphingomonas]|uniref:copper resistance protein B n=1 Tax=unclassified Sphingomonas TaxID=196159 RepID=UPI000700D21D|nr:MULTISPECIES: copper resistance protein B [unclassified Sphingomonas]KQM23892.1 copper resistance protein CopB [Sphingomonas sp. Leaf9]KQM42020.1 copper resistance protein CopB [Sphingomonas sp. Leaf11]
MIRLLVGVALLSPLPAVAQTMDHSMHMPGMTMPARPAAKPARKPAAKPRPAAPVKRATKRSPKPATTPVPHAGHDMSAIPGMAMPEAAPDPHAGHDMSGMTMPDPHAGHAMVGMGDPVGTDLPPGDKPAPAPARDHLADRFWGAQAMATARANHLTREHGGMTFHQLLLDIAEVHLREGRDGYRWEGQGWVGGDIHRLWLKSEGEGDVGRAVGTAEVQALYARALDPYWNLQAGIRHDIRPAPSQTYATLGIEGLAPGFFEVGGALFLSTKGDLLGRIEGYYDQRITNYVVLQPRIEANVAAQDVAATGTGAGLSDIAAGLRLRYEGRREVAPYIGVAWERRFGATARFARARGGDSGGISVVAGVRAWF